MSRNARILSVSRSCQGVLVLLLKPEAGGRRKWGKEDFEGGQFPSDYFAEDAGGSGHFVLGYA